MDTGQRVVLSAEYVQSSTSLGYALTVFRSQGITVDHAFGLAGAGLSQEAGYTQLSRGRMSNNLYVASSDNPRWDIGHYAEDRALRDQMAELRTSLSHSEEQRMARDNLPSWPTIDPGQLDATYRQFDQLGRELTTTAPIGVLQELLEHRRLEHEAERAGRVVDAEVRKETGQLARLHAYREAWITEHRGDFNTWARLDDALRRHEYRLGQAAAYSRPEHVTSLLGPVPTSLTDTERWQTAAGAVEAYRSRWGISGEQTLGPEPTDPEQYSHWSRTVATVGDSGFFGGERSSGTGPDHEHLASHWRDVEKAERQHEREEYERHHPPPEPTRHRHRNRDDDRSVDRYSSRDRGGGFGR